MAKTVCVTGGLGFIGSRLCAMLAGQGYEVLCVDRLSGTYARGAGEAAARMLEGMPGVRVSVGDLSESGLEETLRPVDSILHLAALPGVRSGHPFPVYWMRNALLTDRLVSYAARRRLRLVLASSSSIYGDAVRHPTPEHSPPSPLSAYALSKLAAEHICLAAARRGADTVIARLFTVFGPQQRPDMALARWIDAIARGAPILWQVPRGGARELTYVDDAARGLIAALERGRAGEAYNVGGTGSHRMDEVLELLEEEVGRPARIVRRRGSSLDPVRTEACRLKSTLELGYRPLTGLEEGLRRQIQTATRPAGSRTQAAAAAA